MTESPMLGFRLKFEDLYRRDGLVRLDVAFVDVLKARSPELHNRLMAARAALASEASGQRGDSVVRAPDTRPEPGSSARAALASEASGQRGDSIVRAPEQVAGKLESDLIVALAPELEEFIAELF